ncbi:MAG: Rieske 2Fe-2S domain-containing protein [Acidobacteriota bacterium]|nr:Rieske 2Fe-2S domain-containing protein [Acidobacteriota bacterium]
MTQPFDNPRQLLPPEAYFDAEWLDREVDGLFDRSWVWAATEEDLKEPGDFRACRVMNHSLFVLRDEAGELQAFHNVCRHRGCEILEGSGNLGGTIRCPYHRWTYETNGALHGVPNEEECFGAVPRESFSLHRAAVGAHRGMVYVNPDPDPPEPFDQWIAGLDEHAWPHDLGDGTLSYAGDVRYEMHCNWKVFYENAIDGYHLGYLHNKTLGAAYPDRNIWHPVGRHTVWYSIEREGDPQSTTVLSAEMADAAGATRLPGHEESFYPGVVMLFPLTILSPSPWGFHVSLLEPKTPDLTTMWTQSWTTYGSASRDEAGEAPTLISLANQEGHPMESGNFQLEDMWICEMIQRNLRSPKFKVGRLAAGFGAESPIMHFQQSVLDYLNGDSGGSGA